MPAACARAGPKILALLLEPARASGPGVEEMGVASAPPPGPFQAAGAGAVRCPCSAARPPDCPPLESGYGDYAGGGVGASAPPARRRIMPARSPRRRNRVLRPLPRRPRVTESSAQALGPRRAGREHRCCLGPASVRSACAPAAQVAASRTAVLRPVPCRPALTSPLACGPAAACWQLFAAVARRAGNPPAPFRFFGRPRRR